MIRSLLIQIDDRKTPNCLFFGDALKIIDHELAFGTILFRKQPWETGGLNELVMREKHIFSEPYFNSALPRNYDRFIAAWLAITNERLIEYKNAIPHEWVDDGNHIDGILDYLKQCRDNIHVIIEQALQVLK